MIQPPLHSLHMYVQDLPWKQSWKLRLTSPASWAGILIAFHLLGTLCSEPASSWFPFFLWHHLLFTSSEHLSISISSFSPFPLPRKLCLPFQGQDLGEKVQHENWELQGQVHLLANSDFRRVPVLLEVSVSTSIEKREWPLCCLHL